MMTCVPALRGREAPPSVLHDPAAGLRPISEIAPEDLDLVGGGAKDKIDLKVKKLPNDAFDFSAGVTLDSGWGVSVSVGTDGSGSVGVTIPF